MRVETPWSEFVATQHRRRAEKDGPGVTFATYREPCPCKRPGDKNRAPCPDLHYAGGDPNGHRLDENVLEVTALGLDLDKRLLPDGTQADIDRETAELYLARLASLRLKVWVYSTHSATAEKPSLRAIVALSRPVPKADWRRFWITATAHLGVFVQSACQNEARFWYLPSAPEGADVVNVTFPGAPLDVDAVLVHAPPAVSSEKPSAPVEKPLEASPRLIQRARELLVKHGPAVQGEEGDQHTLKAAFICRDLGISEEDAVTLLLEWDVNNRPPWGEDIEQKVRNAYAYAKGEEGSRRLEVAVLDALGQQTRPFEVPGDPLDPWPQALLKAQADLEAYRGTGAHASQKLHHAAFEPASSLLTRDWPATPWLIQGLVTEGSVGVTSAEPKSIKTWIELENALAVATGTRSMGEFETGQPRPAALFLAEDDARSARNRLRSLAKARGMSPEIAFQNLHVACRKHLDLANDTDLIWILASCRMIEGLALVVLDPLRDVHAADENDSTGMADVMGRLRTIRDLVGCAVRTPHHAKKEASGRSSRGGQNMRGSSAIHGAIDCGMYLDGLDSDGRASWTVRVSVEIKAARGAGAFDLGLKVTDNADGEAMEAAWAVTRTEGSSKATQTQHDIETKLLEIVSALDEAQLTRGIESLGVDKFKGAREVKKAALALGKQRGYVAEHFRGSAAAGWRITDVGRQWLKSPPSTPTP